MIACRKMFCHFSQQFKDSELSYAAAHAVLLIFLPTFDICSLTCCTVRHAGECLPVMDRGGQNLIHSSKKYHLTGQKRITQTSEIFMIICPRGLEWPKVSRCCRLVISLVPGRLLLAVALSVGFQSSVLCNRHIKIYYLLWNYWWSNAYNSTSLCQYIIENNIIQSMIILIFKFLIK